MQLAMIDAAIAGSAAIAVMKLGFPDDSQTEENIGTFPARLEGGAGRCGAAISTSNH
jgi:hypothetical protein